MSNADERPSHTFVQYLYPDARGCLHQDVPSGPFCGRPSRAHQPAPSGDEAKVRTEDAVDIAKRHWDAICAAGGDQLDYVTLDDACVEAYAAGKADGAREVREHEPIWRPDCGNVEFCKICHDNEWDIHEERARRGSEGK